MSSPIQSGLAGLMLASALVGGPALAETVSFKADLKAESEVPPSDSAGTGSLTATYDTATKTLSWTGTVSGLTGNATAAHFHGPAAPGKNAGVLVPAPKVTAGPFAGSATLKTEQARALMAGNIYFNVHTPANPDGELRGQVVKAK